MKVKLGKYKSWFGPYQLAELLCFWVKEVDDEYGFKRNPDWVHNFGEWLAHGNTPDESDKPRSQRKYPERPTTWLYKLLMWIDSKKKRTVKVHIDRWDTWNMQSTLALIILPMLKQLQQSKQGAPFVHDEDVPENLRSTAAPKKEHEYDTDDNWFLRWDWVIEEMIWTFEQLHPDNDWEAQYRSGTLDTYFEPCDFDENGKPKMYRMAHGPDDTFKWDEAGMQAHYDRIQNGCRLFGKYFQNLVD